MKKVFIIIVALMPTWLSAQLFYNNGATFFMNGGAIVQVNGSVGNNSSGTMTVSTSADANLYITGDITNNATINGAGLIHLWGNWINNATFNGMTGTVYLKGGNQQLSGSVVTTFNNLNLQGSGVKTQTINQITSNTLNLNDRELATQSYTMHITNNNTAAIQRTSGFVSSSLNGALLRNTNQASEYLFPTGSSTGTTRYRPMTITPVSAAANTYSGRLANLDASTEGFNRMQKESSICEVNPYFYHNIGRTSGADAADVKVYYDPATDGAYQSVGNWHTAPTTEWYKIAGSITSSASPMWYGQFTGWNTFSQPAIALVRNNPTLNLGNDTAFCAGNSLTLNAGSGYTYNWSTGVNTQTINVNSTGSYSVTITSGSCTANDAINVTLNPLPVINLGNDTTFCTGNSITLNAGNTGSSYNWSGGLSGTQTQTVSTTGTYSVTVTSASLCSATDNINVNVINVADATITTANTNYCTSGLPFNLTAVTAGGTWSGTGITNATNGTFNPGIGQGTYTISYGIAGSCGDTAQIVLNVTQSANAAITPAGPFCINAASGNLNAVTPGGTWNGNGITNTALGTFNPSVAGAGSHTITYGITGACGDTATTVIVVNAQANSSITTANTNYCSASPAFNLTSATTGGLWSGTGITNAANGTFNPSVAGAGTFVISYGIAGSCGDTSQITLNVTQSANATISSAGPFCLSSPSTNLIAATTGGLWSGTGITNTTQGTFNPSIAGVGSHTVTYGIAGTCGDTATTTVVVNAQADATITTAITNYCSSSPAFNLTSNSPGGVWSGTGITNASQGTFNPSTAGAGVFNISYGIAGTCGDTAQITLNVTQSADATITQAGPFCINDAAQNLQAADNGGVWSGDGITDSFLGTFNPSSAGAGTFTITYGIAGQCGDTANIQLTVNPQADASITSTISSICSNDPVVTLTAANPGGTWSGNGITNTATGIFDPSQAGAGAQNITYTIAGSCGDNDVMTITVFQSPGLAVQTVNESCIDMNNGMATLDIMGGTTPFTYHWSNGNSDDTASALSPGSYSVTMTDANNCKISESFEIIASNDLCFEPVVWLPNAFSPNNDGNNDVLYVQGRGIDYIEFIIFDRWGEKIFESNSIDEGWDGSYKGQQVQEGVYVYMVKVTFPDQSKKDIFGNVTLFR